MMQQEKTEWLADARSDGENFSDGSMPDISPDFLPSSDDSLPRVITRLAAAMEEQNLALWSLIGQTAALIEMVAEGELGKDEATDTYLDGTRIGQ